MKPLVRSAAVALLVQAQATVLRADRSLSPAEDTLRNALYQLRDTLAMLAGSASRMNRDFQQTSAAALVSRARQVEQGCQAGRRNIPQASEAVRVHPMRTRLETHEQVRLLAAYPVLDSVLSECAATFGAMAQPGKGEEVRGYGNARLVPLQTGLVKYSHTMADFLRALRIPNRPLGSGPDPFASGSSR
jgi:hypothetical protein